MNAVNKVFIASSLDGFIADRNGGLDWLNLIPNPDHKDLGYESFMNAVDAIVMGRHTFDTVCSFDMDWPYHKPVFVLSSSLVSAPEDLQDKVEFLKGSPGEVLEQIHRKGYSRLYIDGGVTIQNFLKEDLIDEIIITTIPILLGGGAPLFGELPDSLEFEHVKSTLYLDAMVQDHYKRLRS
jgi:dihydrofolate reductase